jgi:alkylation response protein AidB-like acyl-CoA dehydrogenase
LLRDHQLIRRLMCDMITNSRAARLLCIEAGYLKDSRDPSASVETQIAKYFSSRAAAKAASVAVQIHGANGCMPEYGVERYFRDAKIMEIIEGSNEIQQITIAEHAYHGF